MSLRRRLLFLLGLTLAAAAVGVVAAAVELRTEERIEETSAITLAVIRQSSEFQSLVSRYSRAVNERDTLRADSARTALNALGDSLAVTAGRVPDRMRPLEHRIRQLEAGLRSLHDTVAGRRPPFGAVMGDAHALLSEAAALMAARQAGKHALDRRLDGVVFTSLVVLFSVLLLAGWWLTDRVARRVVALQDGAAALARGDLAHRVRGGGTDEIGVLTNAFNHMAAEVEGAVRFARLKVEELEAAREGLARRVRQQVAIVDLGARALADGVTLADLERETAAVLADGLEVEFTEVLACQPGSDALRLVAGVGWPPGHVGTTLIQADTNSHAGFTLKERVPVVVDDLPGETRFRGSALLTGQGVRSGISAVVGDPAHPYGAVGAYSAASRRFTEDDVAFVQAAANLLAQAAAARTAHAALRESEARYQDLYDHSPALHWSVDLDTGRILACNRTAGRTLGYDRTELIGQSVFDLYAPTCHDRVRAGIRELRDTGEVRDQLLQVRRRDGTVIDVNLQATAVRDAEGRVIASRSTWIDVSARMRAERALRRSRDSLARAERVAQMGHWHYDADLGTITWSDGHARLFGIDAGQFDGTYETFLAMVHPADRTGVETTLRRCLAEGRGAEGEYRIVRADGTVRYVRATAEVAADATGAVTSLFGTTQDVTDRRRLERQLRHVVEHSSNLFYTHTPDHILTYVSPQSRDLLDCEPHEALVRWVDFLTDHPDNQAGMLATERAIATGTRQPPYELQLRTARGRVIWVEVRETPLVQDGRTVAIVGALTDITQRREMEEALRRERELLDRIVNSVPAMVGMLDPGGRLVFVNRAWEQILGWPLSESRAHSDMLAELYPDPQERERTLASLRAATGEWEDFRTRVRDGRILDTMWANVRLSDGSLIGIGQDITERKAAEDEVRASRERLRELAFAQEQAREAERARLARELHDEMGQALTGFKMDLAWLRTRLPPADGDAQARAAEALGLVNAMVDVVRRMSGELRPGVLDDLGLGPAIRWQAREFQRRSGLSVRLTGIEQLPDMDTERALAVFRIVQEALTNVVRHADATTVQILASAADGSLRMEVRDDGRGMPPAAPTDRAPLGILGMQERAAAWGGTVSVSPASPRGTVVALEVPVSAALAVSA